MLGEALRCIRIFHDLNQSSAAKQLGISRSYLSEIESGSKEPTLQLVQRYADIFGLPASSIMFFAENLSNPRDHTTAKHIVAKKVLALMGFLAARAERSEHGE